MTIQMRRRLYSQRYARKNSDKNRECSLKYYRSHKEQDAQRFYHNYKTNPQFRVRCNKRTWLNKRVAEMVRGIREGNLANMSNRDATMKYLTGKTCYEFLSYLKTTLPEGFNITDYRKGVLELDHITPLGKFDLLDEDQLHLAFDWSNTRLVESAYNRRRARKLLGTSVAIGVND